jgi:hypothetical protein
LPHPDIVPVLDADPELGEHLAAGEFDAARRALVIRTIRVPAGTWRPQERWTATDHPAIGLLVLEGLVTRQTTVAGRHSTELVGPGDLLRPWDQDNDLGTIQVGVEWRVMSPLTLGDLDERFMLAAHRWPGIGDALASRALRHSGWLAFLLSLKQIMRVEGRLLVLFWALADRWGVVTPTGVHLRLKLTHEALGKLVGARRPSVTTALGGLTGAGAIERTSEGYRLLGDPEQVLQRVVGEPAAA